MAGSERIERTVCPSRVGQLKPQQQLARAKVMAFDVQIDNRAAAACSPAVWEDSIEHETLKEIEIFNESRIDNPKSSRHQKQLPDHGPV